MKLVKTYQTELVLPSIYVDVPLQLVQFIEPDQLHVDFNFDVSANLVMIRSPLTSTYSMKLSSI